MNRVIRSLSLLACIVATQAIAQDAPPDERGLAKIQRFMEICLTTPDMEAAGRLLIAEKVVHVSKRDKNNPVKLNPDSMRFAFKKAHGNVAMYQTAAARVQLTGTSAVGFGPTAQKGKLYKYFMMKKDGVDGMPAPIQVFYPENGEDPVVYDFGSF